MDTREQVFQWNENDITIGEPHTSYLENSWEKSYLDFLKTNSIRNLHMLWKYLHHLVRKTKASSTTEAPFSFMSPEHFCNLTQREFMSWRLEECNQSVSPILSNGYRDIPSKTQGMNPARVLINSFL